MTNYSLSRRRMLAFAGTALSTSAFAGAAPSLESLLLGVTGETRVRQILKKHFKLESHHDSVVKEFFLVSLPRIVIQKTPDFSRSTWTTRLWLNAVKSM